MRLAPSPPHSLTSLTCHLSLPTHTLSLLLLHPHHTHSYLMDPEDEDDCLTKAIGTDIKWKAGKNLTVHMVEKKQKKKGKVICVE